MRTNSDGLRIAFVYTEIHIGHRTIESTCTGIRRLPALLCQPSRKPYHVVLSSLETGCIGSQINHRPFLPITNQPDG